MPKHLDAKWEPAKEGKQNGRAMWLHTWSICMQKQKKKIMYQRKIQETYLDVNNLAVNNEMHFNL